MFALDRWSWPLFNTDFTISFSPLVSRLGGRFSKRSFESVALERIEVSPRQSLPTPSKAIYVETDLDRVVGFYPGNSWRVERVRLDGVVEAGPCVAYRLPPMALLNGCLCSIRPPFRHSMSTSVDPLVFRAPGKTAELESVAFATTYAGAQYFGHFISDDLALVPLCGEFAPPAMVTQKVESGHKLEYRDVLGLDWMNVWSARVERPWIFRDAELTDSKINRIKIFREKIRSSAADLKSSDAQRVYFRRRGDGADRAPSNEEALEERLLAEGWRVIAPGKLPLADIISVLRNATLVAGVEGSNPLHAIYGLCESSAMLLIQPPMRFNLVLKEMCERMGLRFAFVVGIATSETQWEVDIDQFLRVSDLADRTR